jgi:hypothetical protein
LVTERRDTQLTLAAHCQRLAPGESPHVAEFRQKPGEVDGFLSVSLTPLAELHNPGEREALWREIKP